MMYYDGREMVAIRNDQDVSTALEKSTSGQKSKARESREEVQLVCVFED